MADDTYDDELDDDTTPEEDEAAASGGASSGPTAAPAYRPISASDPGAEAGMKGVLQNYFTKNAGQQQALQDAQNRAAQNRLFAQIGQSAATIGGGILGAKSQMPVQVNTQPFRDMEAQAQAPVQDVEQQAKLQNAPNKMLQDYFLKQMGINAANSRADKRNETTLAAARIRKSGGVDKISQDQNKADSELGQKLATLGGRGINAKYGEAIRRGQNIQNLLNQYPNLDDMPANQVDLLYKEVDGLINGGAPTVAGSLGMTPESLKSAFQTKVGKIENDPKGAKLKAFIQPMLPYVGDIVGNSKKYLHDTSQDLVDSYQSRLTPDAYTRHSKRIEDRYGANSGGSMGSGGSLASAAGKIKLHRSFPPGSVITLKSGAKLKVDASGLSGDPMPSMTAQSGGQ